MHIKRYFLVFVFLFFSLGAEESNYPDDLSGLTDFRSPPTAIIGGVVNVLTGRYVETTTDYVSASANPIKIERSYSNATKIPGFLYGYSDLNITGTAFYRRKELFEATVIEDGVKLKYYSGKNINNHYLPIETIQEGVSNTVPAKMAGMTTYKNKCWMGKYVLPIIYNGTTWSFYKYEHCPGHYFRTSVRQRSGCEHRYGYYDVRVNSVKSVDCDGKLLAELKVVDHLASSPENLVVELKGDEGKELRYHLNPYMTRGGEPYRCSVTRVESNFSPPIEYEYQSRSHDKPELLTKKIYPEGRFLQAVYSKDPKRKTRVEMLKAPIGTDGTPIPMYRFEYLEKKTNVWDAKGNRTSYWKNKDKRLSRVNHHDKWDWIYRTEELCWGTHGNLNDPSFLRSRHLVDSHGKVYMSKRFKNDERGNVIEESIYGNLSGQGRLRDKIHDTSGEKYKIHYTYVGPLVKTETKSIGQKSNLQKIEYTYYESTNLVRLKTISDNKQIRERYYYEYDPCGVPILEVIDDGFSPDIDNLEGVTQRTIKRVTLSSRGLPIEEVQSYYDLSILREVQLSRVAIHYSDWGHIVQRDYFDCEDQHVYSESWSYNAYGWVTEETDRLGRTAYFDYDGNGNCIRKSIPFKECETLYTYDFSNRLIKEEERHDDGRIFVKSYAYDLKGNKILEVDPFGHETLYKYDEYDRLISKTLPSIVDLEGCLVTGTEIYTYDVMDHMTSKVDLNGNKTTIRTTAYGKPFEIVHPDKSKEEIVYYLDGLVQTTKDAKGTTTFYNYDYKGRKRCELKVSSKNEILNFKEWRYSAFQLLEELDAAGNVTSYHYDGAGRLISTSRDDAETHIFYDTMGREVEKWEKCGEASFRITKLTYDLLDQIIEERVEDEQGNLYLLKEYVYDAWGNCTCQSIHGDHLISTTLTEYNSSGLPVRTLAPDGSETLYHYDTDHMNPFGQIVLSAMTIDAKGNVFSVVYDARNQIASEERKNTYAETVQKEEHFYDQEGQLILKSENVIINGAVVRVHKTSFEYDARGRETAVIEAVGEPDQKITRRSYTHFGEVKEIIKPSGVILHHHYDALCRLTRLNSSDETIDYTYAYDLNDNIIDVFDHGASTHTTRSYDAHAHVLVEKLAHGFSLSYAYDPLGRLKTVELPDHSRIEYGYDVEHLREVKRGNYVHRDHYDLSGKRAFSELINGASGITYAYDECFRPISIDSPYLATELAYDQIGNVTDVDQTDVEGSFHRHYQYDDLNQLISDDAHEYAYDSIGNRLSCDGVENKHNVLNQLLSDGKSQYVYDLNGNLISKNAQSYVYDALDRLIEVVEADRRTTYAYDPFHRRLSKTHYVRQDQEWVKVETEQYLYQGDKEIGSVDSQGQFIHLRVMGIGAGGDVGAAVLMEFEGETFVPLHDYRGNVSALVHALTGEVVESYRYDGFGVEATSSHRLKNPWRFSSKRVDAETGWSYFGARYYDPEIGRWTTPDPMWFVDGTHLYCYVRNNPTMYIDPEGLWLAAAFDHILSNSLSSIFEFNTDFYDSNGRPPVGYEIVPTSHDFSFDHRSLLLRPEGQHAFGAVHFGISNGIFNDIEDAVAFHQMISKMAPDCTSSCNYNSSHGGWDIIEAGLNLLGMNSKPVKQLHQDWDSYFKNSPENSIYIQNGHSQGVIHVRNALREYDPEMRKRIHVIAIAPAAYINQGLCGSVVHYVSKRDFVPWFDVIGRVFRASNVEYLDPHPDAALLDHGVQSPTYMDFIERRIRWIRQNYGDLRGV